MFSISKKQCRWIIFSAFFLFIFSAVPTMAANYTVTVTTPTNGTIAGTDESYVKVINCGVTCSAGILQNTYVTLSATPAPGYYHVAWTGDCIAVAAPYSAGLCMLNMDSAKSVGATFALVPTPPAFNAPASGPMILYTDAPSGPVSGGENNKGAYLSIFGKNFGASGLGTTTKVYIGGVEVDNYRYLGPSKVYDKLGIEQITVQVGALGGPTLGTPISVKVVVGGVDSNTDKTFTPNPGHIFFVSLTGNDSTAVVDDITHPYRYLQSPAADTNCDNIYTAGVFGAIRSGDHIVIRGGNWSDISCRETWLRWTTGYSDSVAVPSQARLRGGSAPTGASGTGWIHITAYPGPINGNAIEDVHYSTPAGKKGGIEGPNSAYRGVTGDYVSISNLRMDVNASATSDAAPINTQYANGPWHIVNNELGPWPTTSLTGYAGGVSGSGLNDYQIYGNYIHDIASAIELTNHGIYIGDGDRGDIAYNHIANITGGNGFQASDTTNGFPTDNTVIHHNVIHGITKHGVNLGVGVRANNVVYGNLIYDIRQACIRFASDAITNMKIYNNTCYNVNQDRGESGDPHWSGVGIIQNDGWSIASNVFDVKNNIFWPVTDTTYLGAAGFSGIATFSHNIFYGGYSGDTSISIDSNRITTNPLLVNPAGGDFTLQISSPAINASISLPAGFITANPISMYDLEMNLRSTFDIGAFEYTLPLATYYISTTGNDGNDGSTAHPFATFAHAWTVMVPGDTLVVKDGTYIQQISPTISGTSGNPIIIKAENDGGAIIDGNGTQSALIIGSESTTRAYITVQGFKFQNSGENSVASIMSPDGTAIGDQTNNIIVQRVAVEGSARFNNASAFDVSRTADSLVEDSWVWGNSRLTFLAYGDTRLTVRRLVARWDGWEGTAYKPNDPRANMSTYNTHDSLFENIVLLDSAVGTTSYTGTGTLTTSGTTTVTGNGTRFLTEFANGASITASGQTRTIASITNNTSLTTTVAFSPNLSNATFTSPTCTACDRAGAYYAGNSNGNTAPYTSSRNNTILGSIFFNNPGDQISDQGGSGEGNLNNTWTNVVAYGGSYGTSIYAGSGGGSTNETFNHVTLQGGTTNGTYIGGAVVTAPIIFRNSLIYSNVAYGLRDATGNSVITNDYNNVYGNGTNYGGVSAGAHDVSRSPGQLYLTRVETTSSDHNAASDGGDMGANVLNRYQDGVLTGSALWPWSYESRLKTDMCETVTRGLCNTSKTLTEYIWEYLGNPIPSEIYNDLTPPTITSVTSSTTNGSYKVGDTINITVNFSEAVTSTGNVTVTLETGTTDRTCTFTISNSSTGSCTYTVQAGDTTGDLTTNSISGTIKDQSSNPMVSFTPATTLSTNKSIIIDTTAPSLSEITAISSTTDTTPNYTFSSSEAGTITYGGDCTSATTSATSGNNTITLNTLSVATHSNCTITITDTATNPSTPLAVSSFTITQAVVSSSSSSSSGGGGGGGNKKKKKKISSKIIYKQGERVAPFITLTAPRVGTLTTKSFSVSGRASDRSGIQAMFVSINGTKKKRANTSSVTYTAKKQGNATINVTAYDTYGNAKVAVITIVNGRVSGVRYY